MTIQNDGGNREADRYKAFLYNEMDKNKDVDVNVWQFNKGDGSAHGFKKVKCYGQSGLYKHMCLDAVISWWMVYLDDKSMPASDKKE